MMASPGGAGAATGGSVWREPQLQRTAFRHDDDLFSRLAASRLSSRDLAQVNWGRGAAAAAAQALVLFSEGLNVWVIYPVSQR